MRERGIILSTEGQVARVRFAKGKQCEGCRACQAFGEGSAILEALNEVAASPGDVVEVEIPPKRVLESSFLVFIVPVLALMVGYFFGRLSLGLEEDSAVAAGFGCLAASFVGLRLYDRTVAKRRPYAGIIVRRIVAGQFETNSPA
jgi:sigma-E factor negative regulatory protein RseC